MSTQEEARKAAAEALEGEGGVLGWSRHDEG
jgi:hypothetical protein